MDTLIVGGGPAGAAAAIGLARAGREVTLIERSSGPHDKVCGDFLGGPALASLARLGIDVAGLGAVQIERVRLYAGARMAEAPLPFAARGLSRRVLDEALLRRAAGYGACIRRGEAARALRAAGERIAIETTDAILADTVLLATGKHDLRGAARPGRGKGAVGLKQYLMLAPHQQAALAGSVELVLLRHGYAGLQLVEGGRAVLCVMRRHEVPPGAQHRLLGDIGAESAHLARRLAGAVPEGDRAVTIARVPYGYIHQTRPGDPGRLFRLGDQAAVIPSIAGEGIAIALASARWAVESLTTGECPDRFHHKLRIRLRTPMRVALAAHRLASIPVAQAWVPRFCRAWPDIIGFTATRTRC